MIISHRTIPGIIDRDVRLIEEKARKVFRLHRNGRIGTRSREISYLGVISVLGRPEKTLPALVRLIDRQTRPLQANLLEVGIGRSRPNRPARTQGSEDSTWLHQRHKWFTLSERQYWDIAPRIFQEIQHLTNIRVEQWKKGPWSGDPFIVPHTKRYWQRRQPSNRSKVLREYPGTKQIPRGTYYSVSLDDRYLVSDICWAELHSNFEIASHLRSLSGILGKILHDLRPKPGVRRPRSAMKKRVSKEIKTLLYRRSLNDRLLFELINRYLPRRTDHDGLAIMTQVAGDFSKPTWYHQMAEQALPDPASRLQGIQLRIIRKTEDYLVFEVFPQKIEEELIPF